MSWVFDHSQSKLAARLVMLSIANHTDAYGCNAWPSQKKIAEEAGVSVATVRRVVDDLVEMGELAVGVHKGQQGLGGRTNYYEMPAFRSALNLSGSETPKRAHGGAEVRSSGEKVRSPVSAEPSLEPSVLEPRAADEVEEEDPVDPTTARAKIERARRDLRGVS